MSGKYITKQNIRSKTMTQYRREARHRAQDSARLRCIAEITEDNVMHVDTANGSEYSISTEFEMRRTHKEINEKIFFYSLNNMIWIVNTRLLPDQK
jgi:hypothetical protein